MTTDEVGGIVRAVLAGVGGVLVAVGYTDEHTVSVVAGAGATVGTAIWSVFAKRRAR